MARIVCAAPPLFGHATPLAALAGELACRGHDVLFLDGFSNAFPLPEGVSRGRIASTTVEAAWERSSGENALLESLDILRDYAVEVYGPMLEQARAWQPDLLIFDQQVPVAAAIASQLNCRFVTSISSPFLFTGTEATQSVLSTGVEQAFSSAYQRLCAEIGDAIGTAVNDNGFSPTLNLCYAPPTFCDAQAVARQGVPLTLVGPAFVSRPPSDNDRQLAEQLAGFSGKRFLVSLGSCMTDVAAFQGLAAKLFRNILLSHNDPDTLFLMVAPPEWIASALEGLDIKATLVTQPFINQFYLMPYFSLVFGHGGYNSLAEALSNGIPVVAIPFLFDQSRMAFRLEELGVGARLSRVRHSPRLFREQADRLLSDPTVAKTLMQVQRDFRRFDGRYEGANEVERLLSIR